MNNCKTCANAIYDKRYGEYKCKKKKVTIYDVITVVNCKDYVKGTPVASKGV